VFELRANDKLSLSCVQIEIQFARSVYVTDTLRVKFHSISTDILFYIMPIYDDIIARLFYAM